MSKNVDAIERLEDYINTINVGSEPCEINLANDIRSVLAIVTNRTIPSSGCRFMDDIDWRNVNE